MKNRDVTAVAGFILLGVLVIYVTVRGLWRVLLLSILYPWDVAIGTGSVSSAASSNIVTPNTSAGPTPKPTPKPTTSSTPAPSSTSSSPTFSLPSLSGLLVKGVTLN